MSKKKIRVSLIIGTRPEAIKLAPLILTLKKAKDFETRVILSGQHSFLVEQVMDLFKFKEDIDLNIMKPNQNLTFITSEVLNGLEKEFNSFRPDLVIVQGDTTTAFAAALASFYQKIPVAHVEAGLRTSSIFDPYPEEANRKLISQIAQLHFAPTELAAENCRLSNVIGKVFVTGNTVIDALITVGSKNHDIKFDNINWSTDKVILTTIHRRENWGEKLKCIIEGLKIIADKYRNIKFILPMHKNPVVREPLKELLGNNKNFILKEPFSYSTLVSVLKNCYLVLTDSGGIQEEAPTFGKPVLILRETTERPEAVNAGTAKLIGTNPNFILDNVSLLLDNKEEYNKMSKTKNPFGDGTACIKIIDAIREFFGEL